MRFDALAIVRKYYPGVNNIVDSTERLRISVSAEDCEVGAPGQPSQCAMARAFQRDFDGAIVSIATAYLVKGDTATRYRVPASVSRELVSFDRSHNFTPGTYELTKSRHTSKPGSKRKRKKATIRKTKNHITAGVRSL